MRYGIEDIEGIGQAFGSKLKQAGVFTAEKLLASGADRKGRKNLAESTGIEEDRLLRWVNHADLMRIKGVGKQFAELLEASGVDTVKELKHRKPENLAAKMAEVNGAKKLTRTTPSVKLVEAWVEQAKNMPAVVSY